MLETIVKIAGCLVLVPIISLLIYQKFSRFFALLNKIPGPSGLPLIGALLESINPQDVMFANDRQRASKYYPIYRFTVFHLGVVCILHPEDLEIVLSNVKHSKKSEIYKLIEPWLGTGLLTSSGKKWQQRRKLLTPAFHFTILQEFIQVFDKCADKLVRDFEKLSSENQAVDIISPISEMTLSAIAETSMGSQFDSKSEGGRSYRDSIHLLGKISSYRVSRPWTYDNFLFSFTKTGKIFTKTLNYLHSVTKNIINERKQSQSYSNYKRQAMLDLLLASQSKGENIDDDGIREEVDTFMFEGHDTTSVALSFIIFALANHPQIQDEVHKEIVQVLGENIENLSFNELQELNYTERCIKESLRMFPSVPTIARETTEDFQTSTGYLIPAGSNINVNIFDIHRSPNLYPEPDKFDPDRFLPENIKVRHPFAYIPFSAGPRNCIGQRFAQIELKITLCKILAKFKLEAVDKIEDVTFISDFVLRTKDGIRVKFIPRL